MAFAMDPRRLKWLCLAFVPMFSGCSYIGAFMVVNLSPRAITVAWETDRRISEEGLFSTSPDVQAVEMDGGEVELKGLLKTQELDSLGRYSVLVPTGAAVITGHDVNPWGNEVEAYRKLLRLFVVQDGDTTVIARAALPSFTLDLGGQSRGLVVR